MMTTNLFVIAYVKQLRIYVVLEFFCLFFQTSLGVGVLNSAIFNSFHNRVEFGTILDGLRNFEGGGDLNPPKYATTPSLQYFFTLSHKVHDFLKKKKSVSTNLVRIISHYNRVKQDTITNVHRFFM